MNVCERVGNRSMSYRIKGKGAAQFLSTMQRGCALPTEGVYSGYILSPTIGPASTDIIQEHWLSESYMVRIRVINYKRTSKRPLDNTFSIAFPL